MDAGAIERLLLKQGEPVTDRHMRALEGLVSRQAKLRGVRTRQRILPWGTITSYTGTGGGFVSPVFQPSIDRGGIRWQWGTIAGIEPVIGEAPISSPEAAPFVVPDASFGTEGALIYFELEISPAWEVTRIKPVASAVPLLSESWRARKLACVIRPDGVLWRALHTHQGWLAVNRRPNGRALHLFWGKF